MELNKVIDRILWREWDPLGVYNEADFMDDEYEAYVPGIVAMLEEGKDATHIADHLAAVAREFMDLADLEPDMRVAGLLVKSGLCDKRSDGPFR